MEDVEEKSSKTGNTDMKGTLEDALGDLNRSIEKMEAIIERLKSGEADKEESIQLITGANDLAVSSSQSLDRVIQYIAYGGEDSGYQQEQSSGQQSLELP